MIKPSTERKSSEHNAVEQWFKAQKNRKYRRPPDRPARLFSVAHIAITCAALLLIVLIFYFGGRIQ